MDIPESHRRFLLIDQGVMPGLFNIAINAAIAWIMLRGNAFFTVWGEHGIGVDLLATGFLLPFATCVIVSRIIGGQIRSGKVPRLDAASLVDDGWHLRPTYLRGALLGVGGVALASVPTVLALDAWVSAPISLGSFVVFKGIWAGIIALFISPLIAWWALQAASIPEAPPERPDPASAV